jgi:hypothetical protein
MKSRGSSLRGQDELAALKLTLFAIPKPFKGMLSVIQENALRSWARLPETEIILFGRDEGVPEAAARYDTLHEPDITYSEHGTPLLDSVFERAAALGSGSMLCYVNADIILFEDLLRALDLIPFYDALIVARRRNVDVADKLELEDEGTRRRFLEHVRANAIEEQPFGSDLFAFRRGIEWKLPSFAVGRPAWDNWLMYRCVTSKIPLVDVTRDVLVVHQNHSYDHVPDRRGVLWEGPEADSNRALLEEESATAGLLDATHLLVNGKLVKPRGASYRRARILMWGKRSHLIRRMLSIARPVYRTFKQFAKNLLRR